MRRIVALGSGIAGWYALRNLTDHLQGRPHIELTVLCESNHLSYAPLLAGLASARFDPSDVAVPFARAVKDGHLIVDAIEEIDPTTREVVGTDARYPFDSLLIDPAKRTEQWGSAPGIHSLQTVADAVKLRDALRTQVSRPTFGAATVAIVGGGATGVQLAGHLASAVATGQIEVTVFESAGRLVSDHPPEMQVAAESHLKDLGVSVRTDTHVEAVAPGQLELDDGSPETADTIVWCGPTRGRTYGIDHCGPPDNEGFITVDETRRVSGMASTFACGVSTRRPTDRAPSPREEKKQGIVAAKNLVASLSGQTLTRLEDTSEVLDGLLWLGSDYLAHRGGTLLEGWAAKTIYTGYHASVLPGAGAKTRLARHWFTESKGLLS